MITVRLTGSHLTIGLRLEISLWIIVIGCLKLEKFITQGIYIFYRCLRGGGGAGVVFVDLLTYINVKFRGGR